MALNLEFMSRPVSLTHSLCHPLSDACNLHVLLPGTRSDTAGPQGTNSIKWREFNRRNATAPLSICPRSDTRSSIRAREEAVSPHDTHEEILCHDAPFKEPVTHIYTHTLFDLYRGMRTSAVKRLLNVLLRAGLDLMFMDRP